MKRLFIAIILASVLISGCGVGNQQQPENSNAGVNIEDEKLKYTALADKIVDGKGDLVKLLKSTKSLQRFCRKTMNTAKKV